MTEFRNGIDHVSLPCSEDLVEKELDFLKGALAPLGVKEQFRILPTVVGLGDSQGNPFLWVFAIKSDQTPLKGPVTSIHMAFKARDRAHVDEFHKAAVAAGGKDNGAPGIRAHYHPGYYAAFIISPAGHNIEVVYHDISLFPCRGETYSTPAQ